MQVKEFALEPGTLTQDSIRLTPQVASAIAARTSRSGIGVEALIAQIDPSASEADQCGSIFKFIDYGHDSIAGMAPAFLVLEGISQFMAFQVWNECQIAGGIEVSTRYCCDIRTFADPGFEGDKKHAYDAHCAFSMSHYDEAIKFWEANLDKNPHLAGIKDSDKDAVKERKRKNYAFDRARVFLPTGLLTNVALIQPVREWSKLCRYLRALGLIESIAIATAIESQLERTAPLLFRFAKMEDVLRDAETIMDDHCAITSAFRELPLEQGSLEEDDVHVCGLGQGTISPRGAERKTRYDRQSLSRALAPVLYASDNLEFASIRDLNRNRSGSRVMVHVPTGFYDGGIDGTGPWRDFGSVAAECAKRLLCDPKATDLSGFYFANLGTTFPWRRATTLDHLVYECELRTGNGTHYRYNRLMTLVARKAEQEYGIQIATGEPL